jgi:hypothetical protein
MTAHDGITCDVFANLKANEHDAAFYELAELEGYARCNRCKNYVELLQGCHHMTCRCLNEFCYLCNAQWKTCRCELWEEGRLLAVAIHRAGGRAVDANIIQQNIQAIQREEECVEHHWQRRDIIRRQGCTNCGFSMHAYLMQCSECDIEVCYTCARHRLG